MLYSEKWQLFTIIIFAVSLSKQHGCATAKKKSVSRDRSNGNNDYDVRELDDVEEYDGQVTWTERKDGQKKTASVDMGGGAGKYVWMKAGEASDGPPWCPGDNCSQRGSSSQWESWGEFSLCSVTCGSGVRVRHRKCPEVGRCHGDPTEEETCILTACPNNKADKPQNGKMEGENWDAGEHEQTGGDGNEAEFADGNEFENEAEDQLNEDHHHQEAEGDDFDDSPSGDRSYRDHSFSGDDMHKDNGDDGEAAQEEKITSEEYKESKSERQRDGEGAEGRGEQDNHKKGNRGDEGDNGDDFDDDTPNERANPGDGADSGANDDILTDDDNDEEQKSKQKKDNQEEDDEEEEDKDEEEEKKGRRRRKRKRKKRKRKKTGSGGSECESSSSSSESTSGSWSYESASTSDSSPEPDRPHTLNIPAAKGALSLHIRPRASSYGTLSSPNADIDDDIRETDDNLSPLTPPSDSPPSYPTNSKGSPDGEASGQSRTFRIGPQGPWQYSSDLNFEDNYAIANQYAMPVSTDISAIESSSGCPKLSVEECSETQVVDCGAGNSITSCDSSSKSDHPH